MHIDHSRLIELLTEASGMETSKVEAQLAELSDEIAEAVSEGDAYEVDGLGVFSGIGNNIIFIPAEDFATEINYKYVGMEPIEIEGSTKDADTEETPGDPEGIAQGDNEEEDDPFAGLLDEEEEVATGSSFVMDLLNEEENDYGDSENPFPEEEDEESVEDADDEPPFDLDALESEEDPAQGKQSDISDEEAKPGPDKWGIDTYKDDADAGMFSGLLGDKKEETESEGEKEDEDLSTIFDDSDEGSDDDLAAELSKQLEDEDSDSEENDNIEDIFGSESDTEEEEDFEDPFESLAEEYNDEKEEEVVPVITNLASESAKKKREEKEAEEDESKAKESSETVMPPPTSRDKKSQPVILWVLLIIVVFAGGTYGLGYFGIIDIPGITPETQIASTQQPTVSPPEQTQPEETLPNESATEEDSEQPPASNEQTTNPGNPVSDTQEPEEVIKEQPAEALVSQNSDVPSDQPMYGLKGVANPEANSGYTIVIYSLSDEGNARNKITELNNDGYRALLASVPSQQYGQLWRVSLGQFESLRTAALAAETLETPFSENYFITKIK